MNEAITSLGGWTQRITSSRSLTAGGRYRALYMAASGLSQIVLAGIASKPGSSSSYRFGDPSTPSGVLNIPTASFLVATGLLTLAFAFCAAFLRRAATPSRLSRVVSPMAWISTGIGLFVWTTAGTSIQLTSLIDSTVSKTVPLALGALAGVVCERSGVINIAIEAMMLAGAFGGVVGASATGSLWVGLGTALVASALVGWAHAGLSVSMHVDHIISGMALNIGVVGATSFAAVGLLRAHPALNAAGTFPQIRIPLLSDIPVLGTAIFEADIFVPMTVALALGISWALSRTRWGLRLRAVGEQPFAAAATGIDPVKTRWGAVMLATIPAGVAGCQLSLGSLGFFEREMTSGRGFIALAAMIIGRWNPLGALAAALLFGFVEAVASRLSILNSHVPSELLFMAPYVITLVVVAGLIGESRPPASDGMDYRRD